MRSHLSFLSLIFLFFSLSVFANYPAPAHTREHAMIFGVDFPLASNLSESEANEYKNKICGNNPRLCDLSYRTIV